MDTEVYERSKSMADRDAAEFLPKIINLMEWGSEEKVLDYGCGAGCSGYKYLLPQIKLTNSKLYSVDMSKEAVEFASKNFQDPCVTFAEADIMKKFPFEGIKFDNIISMFMLLFIRDIREGLKRFHEILNKKGRLGFTIVTKSSQTEMMPVFGESETWKEYFKGYQQLFADWTCGGKYKGSVEEIFRALLEDTGFKVVHLEVLDRTFHFDNTDKCTELWMSVNPFLKNIPDNLRPVYKQDVRKFITQQAGIPYDAEEITLKYQCVVGVVQKF